MDLKAKGAKEELKKSEMLTSSYALIEKYKSFAFSVISKFPYNSIPAWIKFSNSEIENALESKRGIIKNVMDAYILTLLSLFFGFIAVWFIILFIPFLLGAALPSIQNINVVALAAALIAILMLPAVTLLFSTGLYYILAKLLGGNGSFNDTMSVLVLKNAANLILLIPIQLLCALLIGYIFSGVVSYVILFYSYYLMYKGVMHIHGLSSNRSAMVVIGGFIIEVLAMLLLTFMSTLLFLRLLFLRIVP